MEKNEDSFYLPNNLFLRWYKILSKHPDYIFYKAVRINRKYKAAKKHNKKVMTILYGIKANRMASKYNLELYGDFGLNFRIWHGNIVINSNAIIGDNVQLHGNNCIGEKSNGKAPHIGNNVEIGFGASIIGDITIADDIVIGANSVVTKSFFDKGVVVAGCPAKIIRTK